jgi:hypothetical protein
LRKNIAAKAARKMLMKLSTGMVFNMITKQNAESGAESKHLFQFRDTFMTPLFDFHLLYEKGQNFLKFHLLIGSILFCFWVELMIKIILFVPADVEKSRNLFSFQA